MPNDQTPLRVAAVGLGWVSTHRHLPVMRRNAAFHVAGLIDCHPGRAQALAARLGISRHAETGHLNQVGWLDEIDAIVIGGPPHTHGALIREALEAGKHVLTEKPFTLALDEGRDVVALAAQRRLQLAVVHNFQFASSTRRLLADIGAGRLGRLRSIAASQLSNPRRRLPVWYDSLPLGLFYDESPHFFYLLRLLAPGALALEKADVFRDPSGAATPVLLEAVYRCEVDSGDLPVTVMMNFAAPVSEWHIAVMGEEAMGIIDLFRDIYIRLPNDGLHTTGTVLRTSLAATAQHWMQHFTSGWQHVRGTLVYGNDTVFERFAAAVRSGRPPEGIGPGDALAVLEMQHAVIARAAERP